MDVAQPPHIVFESPATCADGHRAQELLEQALARARAPGPGWSVTMRVGASAPGLLHAEGEISDDRGAPVGHRTLERKASECSGLARAIGVWASLVLDAEVNRPRGTPRADEPSTDAGAQADGASGANTLQPASTSADATTAAWPALASATDKELAPDRELLEPRREESRTFEVGAGAFLMTGAGGGLMGGVTPFAVIEVAKGVFVRSALVLGESLPSTGPDMVLLAARMDGCLRVAGLYTSRNGMQFDLCGGTDLGMLESTRAVPYVAVGPSVDLRGELGGDLAAALRGLFDVNVVQVHSDSIDTPLWAGRVELAMSWRLR